MMSSSIPSISFVSTSVLTSNDGGTTFNVETKKSDADKEDKRTLLEREREKLERRKRSSGKSTASRMRFGLERRGGDGTRLSAERAV